MPRSNFGQVFYRKDRKAWYVRVRRRGREVEVRGGEKKRHALAKLEEIRAEFFAEDCVEVEDLTFKDWAEMYLRIAEGTWNKTWQRRWIRTREAAGCPDLHWHDLRHIFATTAVRAGVPLPDVAKALGQSTHAVTCRYGCYVPEDHGQRTRDLMEAQLFGPPSQRVEGA